MATLRSQGVISAWMTSLGRRLALWGDAEDRRDTWRLAVVGLRDIAGVRLAAALALLAGAGGFLLLREPFSVREAHELLAQLVGIAAMLTGGGLFAVEQRTGTFELLWLATGSRRALLFYKVALVWVAMAAITIPAVVLVDWFLAWQLPAVASTIFITLNTLLIVAVMALAATIVPQSWAGALVGGVLIVGLYAWLGGWASAFNPFLNPIAPDGFRGAVMGGGAFQSASGYSALLVPNRVVMFALAMVLLNTAEKRLARAFR